MKYRIVRLHRELQSRRRVDSFYDWTLQYDLIYFTRIFKDLTSYKRNLARIFWAVNHVDDDIEGVWTFLIFDGQCVDWS